MLPFFAKQETGLTRDQQTVMYPMLKSHMRYQTNIPQDFPPDQSCQ